MHGHTTLTASWARKIWSLIELFQGTITLTTIRILSSQQHKYQSVTAFTIIFTSNKGELHQINMCRIFLCIIQVSDITDLDGTRINQRAYYSIRSDDNSNIRWTNQQRPTKVGWRVWQRFLLSITDINRFLLQP
jgi:hypothetical protein